MTGPTYPGIEEVLPQAGRMVLLTRIVGHTEERTTCAVEFSTASPFYDGQGGVPAWVALEYMAQCVAAHGGLRARRGRSRDDRLLARLAIHRAPHAGMPAGPGARGRGRASLGRAGLLFVRLHGA